MAGTDRQDETPTIPLIVIRIVATTASLDDFVAQYCRYFGSDVVFLPTEAVQPPGRRVRFIYALADGEDVISGEGVVLRMRRDSNDARRPVGVEVRYHILDEASQHVVDRLVALRSKTVTVGAGSSPSLPLAPTTSEPPPYVSMHVDTSKDETRPQTVPVPPLPNTRVLPANPFAEVAPEVIDLFVDWTIEQATEERAGGRVRPRAIEFGSVRIDAPRPEPVWRGRNLRRFSAGAATGVAALAVVVGILALKRPAPPAPAPPVVAAAAPVAPASGVAVGGNGVVRGADDAAAAGPRPAATGNARPPSEPAPLRRTVVADPSRPPPTQPLLLAITTTPPGSTVFVDGELRGPSPLTVEVAPGAHDVVAERPRYASAHAHVEGPGRVELTHERPSALLRVTSTPSGAAVRLDGHFAGTTPLELPCAAYEQHRVQVDLDGHTAKRRIYLKPPVGSVNITLPHKRPSIDQTRPVRVANDLGKGVRP